MSPLRQQMDNDMVLRGLADRTREAYIAAVVGIAKYYRRSPEQLSEDEIERYLLHLIEQRKLAWASTNQAACALTFLFHVTLKQPHTTFRIPRRKLPSKLPEILSREEVYRILEASSNLKHRTLLTATYAAGLRVSEVCNLKLSDIDSARMMLRVECGKGAKDRYTLLSPRLLELLRLYWRATGPCTGCFPRATGSAASIVRSRRRCTTRPSVAPRSPSKAGFTACVTPSPRTCWRRGWISTPFSVCSGTDNYPPRRATSTSSSTC